MEELAFYSLAARVGRTAGEPLDPDQRAEALQLVREATERRRRAEAVARPGLVFRLVQISKVVLTPDGKHIKLVEATLEIGVDGRPLQRLTTRLRGALLAWLAVASPEGVEVDLIGGPSARQENAVRNAVRSAFARQVQRSSCPELAAVLSSQLRVQGDRVVFARTDTTPRVATH